MKFNPFSTVGDYPSMLNKIAFFTFAGGILAMVLLRSQIAALDALLAPVTLTIPVFDMPFSLGTVLPALLVALLFRIVKFHDRISDLFGIRARFDRYRILYPLALGCGVRISPDRQDQLKLQRRRLMSDTFFQYASSTPGKAVIDQHAITMALDQWSWYWILVEIQALLLATALALVFTGHPYWSMSLISGLLMLLLLQRHIREACSRYALDEVKLILQDDSRRSSINSVFNEI